MFSSIDLSYEEAIQCLSGETIQSNAYDLGWNLLSFKNLPLGLGKNIGTRINNKYPKNLRILSSVDKLARNRFTLDQQIPITTL